MPRDGRRRGAAARAHVRPAGRSGASRASRRSTLSETSAAAARPEIVVGRSALHAEHHDAAGAVETVARRCGERDVRGSTVDATPDSGAALTLDVALVQQLQARERQQVVDWSIVS